MATSKDTVQNLELKDKISHLLEEARMVLPGTQALLGFQLIACFNQGFERLPYEIRILHLVSLGFIAMATIFLMSPAAFHRIVEKSGVSEKFNRFGSKMILMALGTLLVGLCIDIFIVSYIVTGHISISSAVTLAFFFFGGFVWFGPPIYKNKF